MTITAACMTISVTAVSYFVTFITAIVANPAETVKNGGVSAVSVVIGNKNRSHMTAVHSQAGRARFELAEACTSTVFKTVSLDRSDIYPTCQTIRTNTHHTYACEQAPQLL